MKWIADFEILTPMFLAGMDQKQVELRLSSLKAEIVFWWRALSFQEHFEAGRDVTAHGIHIALTDLHAEECAVFGSATVGQGQALMTLRSSEYTRGTFSEISNGLGMGGCYLGYGLDPDRRCFREGRFSVAFRFRPGTDPDVASRLCRAVRLVGLLGGLGARKRRGFGSLRLSSLSGCSCCAEPYEAPATREDFAAQLCDLGGERTVQGTAFPLCAFARETDARMWEGQFDEGVQALNALGREFLVYRGWGRNGKVAGEDRRANFQADHDWYVVDNAPTDRLPKYTNGVPERANFGLPHNYFGHDKINMEARSNATRSQEEHRRASPLLFHVTKLGRAFVPVATHFDNLFLPDSIGLHRKSGGGAPAAMEFEPNTQVIRDFLDGNDRRSTGSPNSTGSQDRPFQTHVVL